MEVESQTIPEGGGDPLANADVAESSVEPEAAPIEQEPKPTPDENEGEETPTEPQTTSSEISDEDKKKVEAFPRVYKRMKDAEEELKKHKEPSSKPTFTSSNPLELAKTVSALKDFTPDELDDVAFVAKGKDINLESAAKTEEAKTLIAARRKKVAEQSNVPAPSSPGSNYRGKAAKEIKSDMKESEADEIMQRREAARKHGESAGI